MRHVTAAARWARDWARLAAADALTNRRWLGGGERFLVVRHGSRLPYFYDVLLDWLALYFPAERKRFELHPLPTVIRDWSRFRLHLPWLQDPVQQWSATAFRLAMNLQRACERRGVPIVNRVDCLANAGKSEGARRIATAGLRTPRMALIDDPARFRETLLGMPLPLFVREDWGHRGPVAQADTLAEARALDLSGFARAVAVELIDVRSPDGYFRKYRYVVAGDVGIAQTMHIGDAWNVHGENNAFSSALRDEELAFIRGPLREHDQFVAAREALGLDFVAFDFSYDARGDVVVWEANPYPFLHFVSGRRRYRQAPTARVLAAMTRLYLTRAGLPVPAALEEIATAAT